MNPNTIHPFAIHHSHIFNSRYIWRYGVWMNWLFCWTWIIFKNSIFFSFKNYCRRGPCRLFQFKEIHWMSWIETEWMVFHKIYSRSIFYNSIEIFDYYHNNIDAGELVLLNTTTMTQNTKKKKTPNENTSLKINIIVDE